MFNNEIRKYYDREPEEISPASGVSPKQQFLIFKETEIDPLFKWVKFFSAVFLISVTLLVIDGVAVMIRTTNTITINTIGINLKSILWILTSFSVVFLLVSIVLETRAKAKGLELAQDHPAVSGYHAEKMVGRFKHVPSEEEIESVKREVHAELGLINI